MQAAGSLNGFEDVQALIKSKVGDFLKAEEKLLDLSKSSSVSIQGKAAGLLAIHRELEKELGTAQANVTKFTTGAWTFGDMIMLGDTAQKLISHLDDVEQLSKEASGVVHPSVISNMRPFIYVLGGIMFVSLVFGGKKKR